MTFFLHLRPKRWTSSIRASHDESAARFHLACSCQIEVKHTGNIYLTGMSKPANFATDLHLYRGYMPTKTAFELYPEIFTEPAHVAPNLMEPENGERPPLGVISHFATPEDADYGETPELLTIVLYPDEGVFDEIWNRFRTGGLLPNQITLQVYGFEYRASLDGAFWDSEKHHDLPVTHVDLKCGVVIGSDNT